MANLVETSIWEPGVFQFETNTPVLGGPPNLGAGEGLDNVPTQQLANRTKFLLDRLTGIGDTAILTADLNTLAKSGFYRAAGGAVGHPNPGPDNARVIHIEGDAGKASQLSVLLDGAIATRSRPSTGGVWSAWDTTLRTSNVGRALTNLNFDDTIIAGSYAGFGGGHATPSLGDNPFPTLNGVITLRVETQPTATEPRVVQVATMVRSSSPEQKFRARVDGNWSTWQPVWAGTYATTQAAAAIVTAFATKSLAPTGYQVLPGGLIMQWGVTGNADVNGIATANWPIVFPNAVFVAIPADRTNLVNGTNAVSVSGLIVDQTTTAVGKFFIRNRDGDPVTADAAQYIAIGH